MSTQDLTGLTVGRLTILRKGKTNRSTYKDPNGKTYPRFRQYYICRCECGNEKEIRSDSLTSKSNPTKSCGCLQVEQGRINGRKGKIDLKGKTFGRLTVIRENGRTPKGSIDWLCQCECGNKKTIRSDHLIDGVTKSCGCLQKEVASELGKKHGGANGKKIHDSEWAKLNFVDNTSLESLRAAGTSLRSNNTSGVTGVYYIKPHHKWVALITFQKKSYYLGRYKNKADAIAARKKAEKILFDPMLEKHSERIAKLIDIKNKKE